MKLYLLVLTTVCFSVFSHAQRGKRNTPATNPNESLIELNQRVYQSAMALNDFLTAIHASHALIALNQENYRDTLANLYYFTNSPAQAIEILTPLLKSEEKEARMDLMWRSHYALNDFPGALKWLEKLPRTAETYAMIADCQMKLQREGEFQMTLSQFSSASEQLQNTRIYVPSEEKAIKAKSYIGHLVAYSLAMKNKHEEALQIYHSIIGDDPDFQIATENAKALQAILSAEKPE